MDGLAKTKTNRFTNFHSAGVAADALLFEYSILDNPRSVLLCHSTRAVVYDSLQNIVIKFL